MKLPMTLKEIKHLQVHLSAEKIRLLETMNNMLYINADASRTDQYKKLQKEYNDVTERLDIVNGVLEERKNQQGRPQIGVGKPVKITLPPEDWQKIQEHIENGHAANYADYFRQLHQSTLGGSSDKWRSL